MGDRCLITDEKFFGDLIRLTLMSNEMEHLSLSTRDVLFSISRSRHDKSFRSLK